MIGKKHFLYLVATFIIFALGITFAYFISQRNPITQAARPTVSQTKGVAVSKPSVDDESNTPGTLVTKVIDGDTIEIEGGQRVRYIGVDTPETVHPDIKTECLGAAASAKNKELVEGKHVHLEKDVSETDKYGRLLRYVYINNLFVNDYMVREGFANASSYPPDIKYQDQFTSAEVEARENNRGLWGSCTQSPDAKTGRDGCDVKGNISTNGEKIYHMPGQKYYDKTVVDESRGEKYFCSEEEAQNSGFRKSKT